MFERVGAQVARGDCMFRPPLFICCIAKKKDWLGLVVVVLNHTLTISLVKYLK
jgi:hypothetical protein